jgi:hypothetical protein
VRVIAVTESFQPSVNSVTRSVPRLLDHLDRLGHTALGGAGKRF